MSFPFQLSRNPLGLILRCIFMIKLISQSNRLWTEIATIHWPIKDKHFQAGQHRTNRRNSIRTHRSWPFCHCIMSEILLILELKFLGSKFMISNIRNFQNLSWVGLSTLTKVSNSEKFSRYFSMSSNHHSNCCWASRLGLTETQKMGFFGQKPPK